MISTVIKNALFQNIEEVMIKADEVAHVQNDNTLNHAMLVLSTVKYSMIPVLDKHSKLVGLINMPNIIKTVTTIEKIDIDQLEHKLVSQAMIEPPVTISLDTTFEKILNVLVDYNFVCVVDSENNFLGIVTRRHVLTKVNHFMHHFAND